MNIGVKKYMKIIVCFELLKQPMKVNLEMFKE